MTTQRPARSDGKRATPMGRVWVSRAPTHKILTPGCQPVPTPWTRWPEGSPTLLLGATDRDDAWQGLTLEDHEVPTCRRLFDLADGSRTIAEIAGAAEVPEEQAINLFTNLYRMAMVDSVGPDPVPASLVYTHVRKVCNLSLADKGESSLNQRLTQRPSTRLVQGYQLQTYHFAYAAASHIASAIASTSDDELKICWSEFLAEEYWHFAWLKHGLIAGGMSAEIEKTSALPATLALINYLRWLAAEDTLAYALCFGIGEGAPERLSIREEFWDAIASHDVVPEAAIKPFRGHELLDYVEEHEQFAKEAFLRADPLGPRAREQIRERAVTFVMLCLAQQDELLAHYGGFDQTTVGAESGA